jgi:hypothetical protein
MLPARESLRHQARKAFSFCQPQAGVAIGLPGLVTLDDFESVRVLNISLHEQFKGSTAEDFSSRLESSDRFTQNNSERTKHSRMRSVRDLVKQSSRTEVIFQEWLINATPLFSV